LCRELSNGASRRAFLPAAAGDGQFIFSGFIFFDCSVKQVSTERLENFCLENLEQISVDKNYIENLVFRLNNDFQSPRRAEYELPEECPKFSTENISNTLKFFLSGLKNLK
jgi:hypothetical protein